jgi:hypothetical protein
MFLAPSKLPVTKDRNGHTPDDELIQRLQFRR